MNNEKIQEQIEEIRGSGYTVDVFDLGDLPMGGKRFDVDIQDMDDGTPVISASGDTEFEAKAAAVEMFNVVTI